MSINYIDVLLAVVVLLSALAGYRRGFILGVLDLARWIGSLLVGLRFYQPLARWLAPRFPWDRAWVAPVAFLVVATAAGVIIHLLGYALLRRLSDDTHKGRVNRALGVLPGLVNGLISAAILSALLLSAPLPEGLQDGARASAVANKLAAQTERLESALAPVFDDAIRQTLTQLTIKPESGETVQLPFKVANTRPRPDLEAQMLELVNRERAAAGLKPLAPDPELTEVARKHSADMFARGYFAHVNPEGQSPFDRMAAAGVKFRTAGENLALAPTLQIAHTGLMNSPGHRANILQPSFGRVGIGIMDGGRRGLMVSQEFRN
ncbi:MAG: CvpA family protein [Acidobacteriota bacterium]|nr:CvpA family protein [Acidobacteriota bacterium]